MLRGMRGGAYSWRTTSTRLFGARPKSEAYGAPPVKSPMSMMPVAIRAIGSGHGDFSSYA